MASIGSLQQCNCAVCAKVISLVSNRPAAERFHARMERSWWQSERGGWWEGG